MPCSPDFLQLMINLSGTFTVRNKMLRTYREIRGGNDINHDFQSY
jgi:hypothetical protein